MSQGRSSRGGLGAVSRRRFLRDSAALSAGVYLSGAARALAQGRAAGNGLSVAVIGGGVAGLTAAHELALRGFEVTVYERKALGGKARSIPVAGTGTDGRADLPAEHGFRAEFGFYQNLDETMRRIPYPGNANGVYDNMTPVAHVQLAREGSADLTAPIDWTAFDPRVTTFEHLQESVQASLYTAGEMPAHEVAFFAKQTAMYFTSSEQRRFGQWEYESWWDYTRAEEMSEEYRRQFAGGLTRNLAAAKPDEMSVNSTGLVGESFAYSLARHPGGSPEQAPDRVLNAPTNEAWIDPWVAELKRLGVELRVGETVERIRLKGGSVRHLNLRDAQGAEREVTADWVVCAVPVERARALFAGEVLAGDPSLESVERLRTEWMNGVIFHLDREVPICNGHVNYIDSPFALTSISQAQHWDRDLRSYGDGRVRESLSTIISDWSTPGILYGKPAWALTPEQISDEVWAQLKSHLNDTRTRLRDEWIVSRFVDPAISYPGRPPESERIAENDEPLLINTPGSWDDRPQATTAIPNLILAGDYVRNTMNVATMESACETGKRAVKAVVEASGASAEPVRVHDRWVPPENEPLKRIDAERYRLGLPHVLDTPWLGDVADPRALQEALSR